MKTSCPLSRSLLIVFALACTALLPAKAFGVSPPPIGGYPGENTATGDFALLSLSSGRDNTAIGFDALLSTTMGNFNTGIGAGALFNDTTGSFNTATGFQALVSNTSGTYNTAIGYQALYGNTIGSDNTASGVGALGGNTTGIDNTATGSNALVSNTTGSGNMANGARALYSNTTGYNNTADGPLALESNTTANNNTATGALALENNITGTQNTATGAFALEYNTTANNNTATGFQALQQNTTGTHNTAIGESALKNNTTANNSTADGFQALFHNTTGANNTAIGFHAIFNNNGSSNIAVGSSAGVNLTTGSNNIDVGNLGAAGESNTIRVGSTQTRTFIKGISGVAVTGTAVVVNAGGQLGVAASSARFKDDIKPMNTVSEAILALRPVTFRYKQEIDPERTSQFGLVAEEVEKVNPDLVARDADGKVYTVRYEAVNAMLLNEFLKEHKTVQELKAKVQKQETIIAQQQNGFESKLARQQKQIEALTSGFQKVSAQIEMRKPTPRIATNHP
jgi:hypothetical protein